MVVSRATNVHGGLAKLDGDWFLLPHLWKISFTSGTVVGYHDGSSWGADEYGRHPGDPKYKDEDLHEREWGTHLRAQKEWAKKRAGRSVAHVDGFRGNEEVGDKMMEDYLTQQGLSRVWSKAAGDPP
jgi:hypothetical protein